MNSEGWEWKVSNKLRCINKSHLSSVCKHRVLNMNNNYLLNFRSPHPRTYGALCHNNGIFCILNTLLLMIFFRIMKFIFYGKVFDCLGCKNFGCHKLSIDFTMSTLNTLRCIGLQFRTALTDLLVRQSGSYWNYYILIN